MITTWYITEINTERWQVSNIHFPGFGERKIYKARIVPLKENIGKSKGYRAIFQLLEENYRILVFTRHGIYRTESKLIKLIKERAEDL